MFNIGDKVVPHTKTRLGKLEDSNMWRRAQEINQPFLYVQRVDRTLVVCSLNEEDDGGDHFSKSDLTLYIEHDLHTAKEL